MASLLTIASTTLLALAPAPSQDSEAVAAVALDWRAPRNSCPQRDRVEARIRELLPELDELAEVDEGARVAVWGRVDLGEGERWTVSLRFESDRGVDERSFSAASCEAGAEAAALVIAVTVDPLGVAETVAEPAAGEGREEAPEEEPEPAVVEPDPTPEVVEPEPELEPELDEGELSRPRSRPGEGPRTRPRRSDGPRPRVALGVQGGGGWGPLRLATAGLGLELAIFGERWRAGVRGLWLPPRVDVLESGEAARYDGFAIAARGCGVPRFGGERRVELPLCAGFEAGALGGRGTGLTPQPRAASQPWVAAVLGPGLRWAVRPRVALGVDLDLLVSLVRGGFAIDEREIQRVSAVGVRALAGVELRLP